MSCPGNGIIILYFAREAIEITLRDFGWDQHWEDRFIPFYELSMSPARVTAVYSQHLEIRTERAQILAVRSGKLLHQTLYSAQQPTVGDYVAVLENPSGPATIMALLPRKSCLQRQEADGVAAQVIAANVDTALLIQSLSGDYNITRAQRYLSIAWDAGIVPLIVLTKADAVSEAELHAKTREMEMNCPGAEVLAISSVTGLGRDELWLRLKREKTFVAIGSSGVGKSTLLNLLMGEQIMATREVRADDQRGKHTTTHRQLFRLPNGALFIDTPGMRELGLFTFGGVSEAFSDVIALAANCRFRNCSHNDEPSCAVREAIEAGELTEQRWADYVKLQSEEQHFAEKQILLRKKIANTKKKRNKIHYKDHIRGVRQDPGVY